MKVIAIAVIMFQMWWLLQPCKVGGWSVLLGKRLCSAMKHTSSSGRWMHEDLTKGCLLGKTLSGAVSKLGLVGSLALFKEIEQAIEPSD